MKRGGRVRRSSEGFLQVGSRASLDGTLSGRGLALVHGCLAGRIDLDGDLIISRSGRVSRLAGRVSRLRVEGIATCEVISREVEVLPTGRLDGRIEAERIEASAGALVDAVLKIRPGSPLPQPPGSSEGATGR